MASEKREIALAEAREEGKRNGAHLAGTPAAKDAATDKERRMLGLGFLRALQGQEETSVWLGEEGEQLCYDAEDDKGDIWVDAEEAWLAGFAAGLQD